MSIVGSVGVTTGGYGGFLPFTLMADTTLTHNNEDHLFFALEEPASPHKRGGGDCHRTLSHTGY